MNGINNNGIESVLGQLRALQARSQDVATSSAPLDTEFSNVLTQALKGVNEKQAEAAELTAGFVAGDPKVDLAQAMLAVNRASVSFNALAEVRNRVVSSYQDIMNMPI